MATDVVMGTKSRMLALAIAYTDLNFNFNKTRTVSLGQENITKYESPCQPRHVHGIKGLCHELIVALDSDHSQLHHYCLDMLLQESRKELNLFHLLLLVRQILIKITRLDREGGILARSILICLAQSPNRLLRRILLKRLIFRLRQCVAEMSELSCHELDMLLYLLQSLHSALALADMELSDFLQLRIVDDLHCCHQEIARLCQSGNGTRFVLARNYLEAVLQTAYQKLNP